MSALLAGAAVFQSSTKTTYIIARAAEYLGTTLFYGGLAFLALLWPAGAGVRNVRVLLICSWVVGAVACLASLGLEGAWAAHQPASGALRSSILHQVLTTDFGHQYAAKGLLWLLALVVLADVLRRGEHALTSLAWRVGFLAVSLGTLRIAGLTGHSHDTPDPVLSQLADLAHLIALCLWIGGLAMLLLGVLPRRDSTELRQIVPRYSKLAMGCVCVVVASGAVLGWRIVGTVNGLTSTTYGHLLLVKIGLLAVILAGAYGSKIWVAHRLDFAVILRGEGGLVRPFVLSVAAETAIVTAVLTVASFLVTADPGQ
jgi:copper transport protein